jgi:hypothetical protein
MRQGRRASDASANNPSIRRPAALTEELAACAFPYLSRYFLPQFAGCS